MGSSLNTDQDQDVMVLNYPEHDVCCKAIPNHGGRLNMRQTSCDAKLAMEEIPASCRKCKGIKLSKKEAIIDDSIDAEMNPKTKECRTCLTLIGTAANYCSACMQDR